MDRTALMILLSLKAAPQVSPSIQYGLENFLVLFLGYFQMNNFRIKLSTSDRFVGFSRHAETFVSSRKRRKIHGVGDSGIVRKTIVCSLLWVRLVIRTQRKIGV